MKKVAIITVCILAVCLSGCGTASRVSSEAHALYEAYTVQMDAGKTTPAQDKEFIKATRDVVFQLDRAIRGQKKAQATADAAKLAAQAAVNPSVPKDLSKKIQEELDKEDNN